MNRHMNETIRAAMSPGIDPYGWGNGKARERPKEQRTPVSQMENNTVDIIA